MTPTIPLCFQDKFMCIAGICCLSYVQSSVRRTKETEVWELQPRSHKTEGFSLFHRRSGSLRWHLPSILVLTWNSTSAVDSESHNAVSEAKFGTLTVPSVSTRNVLLLLFPSFILMDYIFPMSYSMPRGYKLSRRSELNKVTQARSREWSCVYHLFSLPSLPWTLHSSLLPLPSCHSYLTIWRRRPDLPVYLTSLSRVTDFQSLTSKKRLKMRLCTISMTLIGTSKITLRRYLRQSSPHI